MKPFLTACLALLTLVWGGCTTFLTKEPLGRRLSKEEVARFTGVWAEPGDGDVAEITSEADGPLKLRQIEKTKGEQSAVWVTALPDDEAVLIAWLRGESKEKTLWLPGRLIAKGDKPASLVVLRPNESFIWELERQGELEVTRLGKDSDEYLLGQKNLLEYMVDNRFWRLDEPLVAVRREDVAPSAAAAASSDAPDPKVSKDEPKPTVK